VSVTAEAGARTQPAASGPWLRASVIVLWVLTLGAHVLGYKALTGTLWGAHSYAFFSLPVFIAGLGVLALAILPLCSGSSAARRLSSWVARHDNHKLSPHSRVLAGAIIGAIGFAVLWWFRVRHLLLGDSVVLIMELPKGTGFQSHPREPITMWLHQLAYNGVASLVDGMPAPEIAQLSTALESILCGVVFCYVIWKLSGELARKRVATRIGCALLILTQGFVLLFFGYAENYAYVTVAIGVYLLFALRLFRGACGIVPPTLALVAALGLHLSSLALLPSYVFLVLVGWFDIRRLRASARKLVILAVAVAALIGLLEVQGRQYSPTGLAENLLRELVSGSGSGSGWSYALSTRHVRDFFSEQFLIGPFALFFFLPALVFALRRGREALIGMSGFLIVVGSSYLGGNWMAADPTLGYPRDWDVFASSALVLVCAALGLFLFRSEVAGGDSESRSLGAREIGIDGALLSAILISLFHVVPWIVLNTSEARALERTKTLPMDFGRDEMVVGRHYLNRGDLVEAEQWLLRAVEESNTNVNALHLLGRLYTMQEEYDKAVSYLDAAVAIRPDTRFLHKMLAIALYGSGQLPATRTHLQWLAEASPSDFSAWRQYGFILLEMGEVESAREVLERARALHPDSVKAARSFADRCNLLAQKLAAEGRLELSLVCNQLAESYAQ
jgi:tetratricopeptide (TPR) repeat protein